MNGYIRLYRNLLEDPLFTQAPAAWLKVAIAILLNANWKPRKWFDGTREVLIPAGGIVTSRDSMAALCNVTPKQYRGAVSFLEKTGFLGQQRASRYTILTVCNWSKYQGLETDGENTPDLEGRERAAKGPDEGRERATPEERKNVNNGRTSSRAVANPADCPQIVTAIAGHFPHFPDDDADVLLGNLIQASRSAKPDVTFDEIAEAVRQTYTPSQKNPGRFAKTVPAFLRRSRNGHGDDLAARMGWTA